MGTDKNTTKTETILKYLKPLPANPAAWQWENETVGQWAGSGGGTHYYLLGTLSPT